MYKSVILPASILVGIIIGAGMFSLPFVFQSVGILTGFFYLGVFSLLFIVLYWMYADIIVRTPGEHRFVGYAKMYLGKLGFITAFFANFLQLFFVLAIYLILAPSFLKLFVPGSTMLYVILFWVFGSAVILINTRRIAKAEFLITLGIVGIIALVGALGFPNFLSKTMLWEMPRWFAIKAIGPILFALSGAIAIPEIVAYFRETGMKMNFLRRAITVGGVIPGIAYLIFVIGVIGLSGTVSEDAVSGLIGEISQGMLMVIGILGFLSIISSYIVVGLSAR
ncbi:MAG: aromatic amino acid transport family protein, partial [bacterium]|nr:aromatic amino acid transport family protein [bacterium]